MTRITLTGEQAGTLEPLMQRAYAEGGTVFCQCRRLAFPDNDKLAITCHMVPAESSRRLKAWLDKEAARIAQKTAPEATKEEAAV